ncbi:MAG: PIN domain-containing protein [Candidatus Woesearchaeota archaeon]
MSRREFELFSPDFLKIELVEWAELILKKTNRKIDDLDKMISWMRTVIQIVPPEKYIKMLPRATIISPDAQDVQYIALAMHLNCPLWSNDRALKEQTTITIFNTQDVIRIFSNQ